MQKASAVVSVQVPAGNITAYCPAVVAVGSEFRCNASISSGTYLQLTVDWNDGIVEDFPIVGWYLANLKDSNL